MRGPCLHASRHRATVLVDCDDAIQRALQTRAPIEQAKGVLMAIHGVDADQAFDMLRRQSQKTNVPVRVIAADFLQKVTATSQEPPASSTAVKRFGVCQTITSSRSETPISGMEAAAARGQSICKFDGGGWKQGRTVRSQQLSRNS